METPMPPITNEMTASQPKDHMREKSYRRGVHQALSLAFDLVDECKTLGHARSVLADACNMAGDMRFDGTEHAMYLDDLRKAIGGGS